MQHYKSWACLKKEMEENLCSELKGRITYFLTRYHKVHDSYGRAAILLDKKELVTFDWIEMYEQDCDINNLYEQEHIKWEEAPTLLKPKWDEEKTYCEMDFLSAALQARSMPITEQIESDNFIIKIFAILDKRLGKRTLEKMKEQKLYEAYPQWVRQFFELRLKEM